MDRFLLFQPTEIVVFYGIDYTHQNSVPCMGELYIVVVVSFAANT